MPLFLVSSRARHYAASPPDCNMPSRIGRYSMLKSKLIGIMAHMPPPGGTVILPRARSRFEEEVTADGAHEEC